MKQYFIIYSLLSVLSCCLIGCDVSKKDELKNYIANVKLREGQVIDALPPFKSVEPFTYPEKGGQRNPFEALNKESYIKAHKSSTAQLFKEKRISLNFQDIPIRTALKLLADFTKINMVVSDAVSGNITLHLNNVPWQQALNIVLTMQNLDKRRIGNVILIDKTSAFAAQQKQLLEEEKTAQAAAPLYSELLQLNYAKAKDIAAMLKDKSNSLLSEHGALNIDERTNSIWIKETAKQLMQIKKLMKKLDIPVQQVLIEARIVDMTKRCEDDLGIQFGVSKSANISGTLSGANQLAQGMAANVLPLAERLNLDLAALPTAGTPASIGIALAKLGGGVLLDLELSALESEGQAEIIASPRLMTTNQQPAVIEAGQDIPYQQATASGATAVAFKKAVLSLKVTPQITPDGKLLMDLLITQDADSGERVQGVPILLTKAIRTHVLVNNAQTIVLGGIYKQEKNNTITRVPFLGRLPVVGHLFSKIQSKNDNEELLIFITPRIITTSPISVVEKRRQDAVNHLELKEFK
jgi:type IV pilus assembly protein PilQ